MAQPSSRPTSADAAAVVFFCHGARDPAWRVPFDEIVETYRRRFPARTVHIAFLELMAPSLPEVIDQLGAELQDDVRIVPLFLAPGSHTRRDLPALLADASQRWPEMRFTVEPTLTESPAVREAILATVSALAPVPAQTSAA